jgi:hypothetical protein
MTSSARRQNLLIAFLVVVTAVLLQASTAFGSVLQVSDAERPWNQEWASWSCADASRVQQVTSPAVQGRQAYKLTVQDGDNAYGERCELGQGNPSRNGFPQFQNGDERWISFSVYLPDGYPINTPDWNVMFQIHQVGDGGCPPIALDVENGQFKLYNSASRTYVTDTIEKWHAPAQLNRWTKFTLHILNSPDDNTGFVELYSDLGGQGMQQVMPRTYMHTMTARSDGSAMVNHARIGIYRNPAIQGTTSIYFDGFTIATDQASAEASAFGPVTDPPAATPPAPGPNSSGDGTANPTPPGNDGNGNAGGDSGITPVTNPVAPTHARRSHSRRVVLRPGRRVSRTLRAAGWPRVIPVYGWVKGGRVGRRSVIIEIRQNGRWEWLSRGWLRSNGRFYLAPAVDLGSGHRVELRAHVQGLGYSKLITARV